MLGRDAAGFSFDVDRFIPQPIAESHERAEWRITQHQQSHGGGEAAGVGDQIPIACHVHEAGHVVRSHCCGLPHLVGRQWVVHHAVGFGVLGNGRAAQAFQNAELNFMGLKRIQLVKTIGKALQTFSGQAKNQIGVQMRVGFVQQPFQIGNGFVIVLLARNALLHIDIKGLNAHFKLQ